MKIKCKRCDYEWEYTGDKIKLINKYPQYVSCPKCRTSVKLEKRSERLKGGTRNKEDEI